MPGSRRHADPSSLLLPDEQWQHARVEFARTVEQPVDGAARLEALASEQGELLVALERERDATAEARLADGDFVIDVAEDTDTGRLRKLIEARLPEVDLPELLIEVDGWTGFTDHLTPLSGNRRRSGDMPCLLYAAILAQATNLGLSGMPAQLPAARMGVGAALPRRHPHRRQRPARRLPPWAAARADVGRRATLLL